MRRAGTGTAVLAVLAAALLWLPGLVSPSISRTSVRTAVADAGPIEAVITATGTVVPEVEQVVSSPVDARVLRILEARRRDAEEGDPLVDARHQRDAARGRQAAAGPRDQGERSRRARA